MEEFPDSWDYLDSDDQPIRTTYNMGRNWNTEDKFKLIHLCEKHLVLWDTSYQFYRELVRRRRALDEIRQQFDDKFSSKFFYLKSFSINLNTQNFSN